ncbi:MAG: hypothetical protein ACRDTJ_22610 [Pseudonocardiaceae bacterium]
MTDRIEAIRARYSAEDGWFYHDINALLAEVDSLRLSLEYQDGQTASLHGVIAELRALAPVAPDAEPGGGDPWCREESCTWRHWRSGSMPTHRRGDDCPTPGGAS